MELLTIRHQDFEMIVECTKFDDIWRKAKNNVGEEGLHSTYSWSEGVASVTLKATISEKELRLRTTNKPLPCFLIMSIILFGLNSRTM